LSAEKNWDFRVSPTGRQSKSNHLPVCSPIGQPKPVKPTKKQ